MLMLAGLVCAFVGTLAVIYVLGWSVAAIIRRIEGQRRRAWIARRIGHP